MMRLRTTVVAASIALTGGLAQAATLRVANQGDATSNVTLVQLADNFMPFKYVSVKSPQ